MGLATFQAAVKAASARFAPQYGLTPAELEHALLVDAGLEGGLGDTAAVGDNGASVGRFQYNTNGGHGSTLLNQGYTRDQIASDEFQANDWAPILASHLQAAKASGMTGAVAVRQAIHDAERPAAMYPTGRINAAITAANGLVTLPGDPNQHFTLDTLPNDDPNAKPQYTALGGNGMPSYDNGWVAKFQSVYTPRYNALNAKYLMATDQGKSVPEFNSGGDLVVGANPQLGLRGTAVMTAAEYQEFSGLKQAVDTVEAQAKAQGADVQTAIDRAKWQYDSDPANVKADNIAKQYARDMTIRTNATTMARDNLDAQTKNQESAMASFNGYRNGAIYVPSTHPQEPDAIYQDAVDRISKGLPDVPGFADYTPEERAAGSATNSDIAGARAAAQSGTNAAAADWATHGVTPPGTSFGAAPSLGAPTRFNPDNNPDYAPGGVAPTLAAQPPQAAPSGGVSGSILNQGTPQVNGNPIMGYGPITNNGGQWQDAYGQWHSGGS